MLRSTLTALALFLAAFAVGAEPVVESGDPLPEGAIARLGVPMRLRHGGPVNSVAWSGDGKRIVSGCYDSMIHIWDATTGNQISRWAGPNRSFRVGFSSDGKFIATGGLDGMVRLWDALTGKELWTKKDHQGKFVAVVSFSPDGTQLASAGGDNGVVLWKVANGEVLRRIPAHDDMVGDVVFSPNGLLLATASSGNSSMSGQLKVADYSVRLWDLATGQRLALLEGHRAGVTRLAFSSDGNLLASVSSSEAKVRIWHVKDRKELRVLEGKAEVRVTGKRYDCFSVAFSPDGKELAAGSQNCKVWRWEAATGRELPALTGQPSGSSSASFVALAYAPDGKALAGGCADGTIRIWSLATGKEMVDAAAGSMQTVVEALAFSPDGKQLASTTSGSIQLWDMTTRRKLRQLPGKAVRLNYSPDGKWLAGGVPYESKIELWDVATGGAVATIQVGDPSARGLPNLAFSPDGMSLAATSDDTLLLWDIAGRKEKARVQGDKLGHGAVTFSPDSKRLATASVLYPTHDARILIFDAEDGTEIVRIEVARLGGRWSYLKTLAFSADGRYLYAASGDRAVRRWELASGHEAPLIAGPHPEGKSYVVARTGAFSSDRRLLALTDEIRRAIVVYDLNVGKEAKTSLPGEGVVYALAFSPDGRQLVSGHQGGSILIWDASGLKAASSDQGLELPAARFDLLWNDLGSDEAKTAFPAMQALARGGDPVTRMIGARLQTARADSPDPIRKLVARLDHEFPSVREAAVLELKRYCGTVDPHFRKVLEGKPSEQVRTVLEKHLAGRQRGVVVPAGDLLRTVRAVAVLERMGTPAARQILEELAKEPATGLGAQEAKAALERLKP